MPRPGGLLITISASSVPIGWESGSAYSVRNVIDRILSSLDIDLENDLQPTMSAPMLLPRRAQGCHFA